MLDKDLERILPLSLTEKVYSLIKQAILNLQFSPGDTLVEADLAKMLGTSKTPVREALRRLETEGLVVITPYKGTAVSEIIPQDMKEIYEVRGALEGMLAWQAARILSDEQIKELEWLLSESERALQEGRISDSSSIGYQFHKVLINSVGHRRITMMLENLDDHLERFHRVLEKIPGRVARSVDEHRAVLTAIAKRDADAAYLAVINHENSFITEYIAGSKNDFQLQKEVT